MKAIKASKKLITAILSFVLSLVLCAGVCLAWFAVNTDVKADGTDAGVREGDIISFTVKAYYLDTTTGGYKKAETGNVVGAGGLETGAEHVDADTLGLLEDDDHMRPYGGIGNTFATAVLFEIEYELITSNTSYRIFASCPSSSALDVEDSDQDDTFTSGLSNAVGYYAANVSGDVYSRAGVTANKFVKTDDNTKSYVVALENDIVPSTSNSDTGNYVGKAYVIMDYMPENFIYLSSLIIRSGGTLTSGLMLTGDLSINISSYDPNDPDIPVVPDPDPDDTVNVTGVTLNKNTLELTEEETETLRATVAPSNATDKSVTWTTSDSAVATVANGKVTAVGAGTATITVTTTDGEKTATCAVTVKEKQAEPTEYTVSFNLNGHGTAAPSPQTTTNGKITAPTAPTDADYDFEGWTLEGSDTVLDLSEYEFTATTTLYAKWKAKQQTGGATNLLENVSDFSKNSSFINNGDITVQCDNAGEKVNVSTSITIDGVTYDSVIRPTSNKKSFTITANKATTVTVYCCITKGTDIVAKDIELTASDNSPIVKTAVDGQSGVYKVTVTLAAGETLTIKASEERMSLFALFVE